MLTRFLNGFTNLYPLWLGVALLMGLKWPATLAWFDTPWVMGALAIVMLGMGFTLTIDDFRRIFRMPTTVALGFILQYTIMPLSGWFVAWVLKLEPGLAVGLILVASCPGGTASNVITYLARANVALSVVLTMASTLLAGVMTPLWCQLLAGQYVPVDTWGLCQSTLLIVVAPVVVGVLCNWKFPRAVAPIATFGPLASVVAIFFITGGVVAQHADELVNNAGILILATFMLHVFGFALGYAFSRLLGYSIDVARTVSIEVGMQNGGLAIALAKKHFVLTPTAPLPGVFSALMQNLLGSVIAAVWRLTPSHNSESEPVDTP